MKRKSGKNTGKRDVDARYEDSFANVSDQLNLGGFTFPADQRIPAVHGNPEP